MNRTIRKTLSLLLCLVLVVGLFPMAYAEGETEEVAPQNTSDSLELGLEVTDEPQEETITEPEEKSTSDLAEQSALIQPQDPIIPNTASNDYTQWRQGDTEWNKSEAWPASQYPNATMRYMSQAGCLVTSIAMLLRHYNVVADSNVNNFNPWICNEKLKNAGAFTNAADLRFADVSKAYPGFAYQGSVGYSASKLVELYNKGYACVVAVNNSGHYVAVRSATSTSSITIMDPGWGYTSLSSFGSVNLIYYYKATPATYEGKCTYYPSYLTIKATTGTTVKTQPCSASTDSSSKDVVSLSKGDTFEVTGLYKNTAGNYWYKGKTSAGKEGYVYSGDFTVSNYRSNISYSGKAFPSSLTVGKTYDVDWTITSGYLNLSTIDGYIYGGSNYGTTKYHGQLTGVNASSRNLKGSAIDNALLFNKLDAGSYKMVITATATNYYCPDGKTLQSKTISATPISFTFAEVSEGTKSYYLDLNGYLDGKNEGGIGGYGTVDVYINDSLDASGVNDYYKQWPSGTKYEIKNIKAISGHKYAGVKSGSLSGTIGSSNITVVLSFEIDPSQITPSKTIVFNGKTYELYDFSTSWLKAENICESKGGHLVSITSASEQNAILSLLENCEHNLYYIGASDEAKEGTWVWVTGEAFSYQNWDTGAPEPTNGVDENYAAIIGKYNPPYKEIGDWIDTQNNCAEDGFYAARNSGFICEYEKLVEYTISYNANGGTGAPASQAKTHDVTLTLSSTKPTRANASAGSYTVTLDPNGGSVSTDKLTAARTTSYSFKNWNTAANGSGTSYNPSGSYTANAAATLYAQWNSSTTTASVTLPTPTRTGYSFQGWAASSTATSGATGSYTPTGNVTLYATWKVNTYTVSYNANGGTGAPAAQTKTQDVSLTLSSTKPTRASTSAGSYSVTLNPNCDGLIKEVKKAERTTSYTFKNWNTAANGSGTSYASGASYTANASVTLYAQWNSSTSTTAVTLSGMNRTGYSFQGWNTKADGSGTTYSAGSSYTPTRSVTLYAIWKANTYTVSYNANGGTGAPASQTKTYGTALTLSSTKPTRANASAGSYTVTLNPNGGSVSTTSLTAARTTSYSFKNWNTAANGSGTSYNPSGSYTANAAATLYAQWNSSTKTTAVTLPTPTRSGYTFQGWYDGSSAVSNSYTPNGNVTLTAKWTPTSAQVVGSNVAFTGAMQLHTYIVIPEAVLADAGAYATISFDGATKTVKLKDVPVDTRDGVERRDFIQTVYAAKMRDEVVIRLHDGKGNLLPLYDRNGKAVTETGVTSSVVNYLDGRIDSSTDPKMIELARAAKNYGAAAQLYFGYRTELLSSADIAALNGAVGASSIPSSMAAYAQKTSGKLPAGITKNTSSVQFLADNSLYEYFYLADGAKASSYTFTVNGTKVTPVVENGRCYIKAANIPSGRLSTAVTFTVSDGKNTYTIQASPLSYAYGRVQNSTNADMVKLAKALYLYSMAANAYFGT